jgi:hypothetical protein
MKTQAWIAAGALCVGATQAASGQVQQVDIDGFEILTHRVADIRPTLDPNEVVDTIPYGDIDMPSLLAAERGRLERGEQPRKFADSREVLHTPADSGSLVELDNGRVAWRLRIETGNAKSVNLGTHFNLPPTAVMFLLDGDGNVVYGPYTAADVKPHGERWFPLVEDESLEVYAEMQQFDWDAFQAGFAIHTISFGFLDLQRPIGDQLFPENYRNGERAGACNVDVVCPEGNGWENQIDSVGRIITSGSSFCSGTLVNNTSEDETPYFMMADHCGVSTGNDQTVVVYWNFQRATCGAGGASTSDNQNGSTLRMAYGGGPGDITLLELDDAPNVSWGVIFAGWDRRNLNSTGAGIHHPSGDEKKISIENNSTSKGNANVIGVGIIASYFATWDAGVTEPGSSGSAFFNSNGRLIGVLSGGSSQCAPFSAGPDAYARIATSWTGGGTTSTALQTWLDPISTGQTTLDFLGATPPDPPGAFAITNPLDGTTGIDASAAILFTWGASTNADQYEVIIAEDPGLTTGVLGPFVRTTEDLLIFGGTLSQGQTYYWSVVASNDGPTTTDSTPAVASFSTGTPAVTGACCFGCFDLGSGPETVACQDGVLQADCEAAQGKWGGDSSTCGGSPCTTFCSGDMLGDGDGDTTLADFTILAQSFGQPSGADRTVGDLNCDGAVTLSDFTDLASDFGCTGTTGHPND